MFKIFIKGFRSSLPLYKNQAFNLLRSKNANNAFWSALEAVIYPVLMLLTTPYFINHLGTELYGIWMLVNTVVASIGILNVGFGDATIKFVAQYRATNNLNRVHKIIQATYSMYLVLCLVVIAVSFVITFLIKNGILFKSLDSYKSMAVVILPIAGSTLSLKLMEQIFLGAFRGFNRYDLASKISILGKTSTILTSALMVYLGASLIAIFIGSFIVSFIFLMIEAYMVSFFFNFRDFVPCFEKKYIKEIFNFGIWTWFLSVLGLISTQIDKYMVISLADINVFAFYSVAITIFNQIHNLLAASTSWIFPIISNKIANNEDIVLYYKKTQWLFLSLICVGLTIFFFIKDPILLLWLGRETFINVLPFVNLFICFNFIMASTIIPYFFLNGSGHFRLNTYFNGANLVTRILFIPLMFHYFGVEGLVLGLIIAALVVIPFQMHFFSSRILRQGNILSGIIFIIPFAIFLGILWIPGLYFIPVVLTILVYLGFLFKPQLNKLQ